MPLSYDTISSKEFNQCEKNNSINFRDSQHSMRCNKCRVLHKVLNRVQCIEYAMKFRCSQRESKFFMCDCGGIYTVWTVSFVTIVSSEVSNPSITHTDRISTEWRSSECSRNDGGFAVAVSVCCYEFTKISDISMFTSTLYALWIIYRTNSIYDWPIAIVYIWITMVVFAGRFGPM